MAKQEGRITLSIAWLRKKGIWGVIGVCVVVAALLVSGVGVTMAATGGFATVKKPTTSSSSTPTKTTTPTSQTDGSGPIHTYLIDGEIIRTRDSLEDVQKSRAIMDAAKKAWEEELARKAAERESLLAQMGSLMVVYCADKSLLGQQENIVNSATGMPEDQYALAVAELDRLRVLVGSDMASISQLESQVSMLNLGGPNSIPYTC